MNLRKLNKRILIPCEGVTEALYAKALRSSLSRNLQRSIAIEVAVGDQLNPLSLAKEALAKKKKANKEKNPYYSVWLFFDHDNWPQLVDAFYLIEKEKFNIAFTSLCMEHWFILHFEDCGRAFQKGEEVIKHLKDLWPTYHKTKLNHYAQLKSNLPVAVERVRRINRKEQNLSVFERNPYCSIPDLITFFESL